MKTTKTILATALVALATSFSVAQETSSFVQFGVKGGVNFSNLYTDEVDDNNMLTSFNAGLYAKIPIAPSLAIQPEFLFSRKGAEFVYDNAFAEGTARFKLNYLELPILLRINVTENFNIHAGPYFAYLIDAQVTNETDNGLFDFEENYDNDDFNKFDTGLAVGLGFDFASLSIGARYNYGLSTVGKEQTVDGVTFTSPDAKNSNISVYVAVPLN